MKKTVAMILHILAGAVLIAYFFGNSPVGRLFSQRGAAGKVLYLIFSILLAGLICIWVDRYTQYFKRFAQFSGRRCLTLWQNRFQADHKTLILLALIVLAGAFMRFAGLDWSIQGTYQPDEGKLVGPAYEMAVSGYPYHDAFGYPSQCISKLAALFFLLYPKICKVAVTEHTIEIYYLFRGLGAFFSTATIVTAFLIGNYLKKHLGLVFAALVAVFPEFVILSKQVTADTIALFFATLVLLASLFYLEKKSSGPVCLMGLFAAMATMEKWHSAVACFYIAIVVIVTVRSPVRILKQGMAAFFSYVGGMFLIAPNMLWNIRGVLDGILYMYTYDKQGSHPYMEQFGVYTGRLMQYTGVVFAFFSLLGLVWFVRHRKMPFLIVLLGVLKLLIVCFLNRGFPRWGLEFYFTALLITAMGVYALLFYGRRTCWLGILGFCLIWCSLASGSLVGVATALGGEQDTRYAQEIFCAENNITRDNSMYDYYTAFAPGGMRVKIDEGEWIKLPAALGEKSGDLYLRDGRVKYAIDNEGQDDSRETRFLVEQCPIVKSFDPVGPDIFWLSAYGIENNNNELSIIANNLRQAKTILDGAYIGPRIVIYDVSGLPVKTEE